MQTVLITGANRGIGRATADALVARGCKVYYAARSIENLPSGDLATPISLDVTDPTSIARAVVFFEERKEALDVLINNAAIIGRADVTSFDVEEITRVMDTNFNGPVRVTKAFFPFLEKSPSARVIHVSSGMGAISDLAGDHAAYRFSKSALNAFTISLARAQDRVKVVAVCPGWVRSDMGGKSAPRSLEEGAAGIVGLALNQIESGKFYRDGRVIPW